MLRQRIQREIITRALAGPFYAVTYEVDGKPTDIDPDTATVIRPASIRANETGSLFGEEPIRTRFALSRAKWTFQLKLTFAQEATLEAFEERLRSNPPKIEADPAKGYPQVTLIIRAVDASHPVQQQSPSGTEAVVAFEARLGRL